MNKLPVVAVVGRMNVGKSTLFNRLSGSIKAITYDYAGVTRDIVKDTVTWEGKSFELVDTGGISFRRQEDPLLEKVREKAIKVIEQSDLVLLVCDGIVGLVPEDRELAKFLHKQGKQVIVIVNKVDNRQSLQHEHEFVGLGFKQLVYLSAQHGTGIGELLRLIIEVLPAQGKPSVEDETRYRIVLLGRPNVGKSSLMNALTNKERSIVADMPGTTREAIAEKIAFYQEQIELVDTPGIRKKSSVEQGLETMMVQSSLQAIKETDIVLLLIDASVGALVDQELKLGFYAFSDLHKALILLINKEDLATEDSRRTLDVELDFYKHWIQKIPVMHISCKTGKNVGKVLPLIKTIWERYNQMISDEEIMHLFKTNLERKPLMHTGERLYLHRAYQIGKAPMRIVLEVNQPDWFGPSQLAFFENLLRKEYNLIGVPVKFIVKKQ